MNDFERGINYLIATQEAEPACRTAPDNFGEVSGENKHDRIARETKAIALCKGCSVLEMCLQGAILRKEPQGVWGGVGRDYLRAAIKDRKNVQQAA